MKIQHKPITTQEQYEAIAARMEQLKDAEGGTPEAMEMKLLTKLIVEYEERNSDTTPE